MASPPADPASPTPSGHAPGRVIALAIGALALLGGLWWLHDQRVERARHDAEREAEQQDRAQRERLEAQAQRALTEAQALLGTERARAARLASAAGVALLEAREALLPLGRMEALERLARAALETYEGRPDEDLDPAGRELKGSALGLLAEALAARGQLPEACDAARQALALAQRRADAEPASATARHALARAHGALGEVLSLRSDHAGAVAERREALALLRKLNDEDPKALGWLGALAEALADAAAALLPLGDLRLGAARAHAEEAVTLARTLREREPSSPVWARIEARGLAVLAKTTTGRGIESPAPREAFAQARALLEPLVVRWPRDQDLRAQHAELLLDYGAWLARASSAAEAVEVLRAALEASADLAVAAPASRPAGERLARACVALADAFEAQGELDTALEGRGEALRAWRRAAELAPDDPPLHDEILQALLAQGDLLARLSRGPEALAVYREAADLAGAQAAAAGTHPDRGSDLAECHDRLASTLLQLGRRAEALEAWRSALAAIEPLAKKTPENAFFQADLARIWWHLGQALLSSEPDRPEGERSLRRALRYLEPLESSNRLPAYAASWPAALRAHMEALAERSGVGAELPGAPVGR